MLNLLWIIPLTALIGFQIGSIVEYKKKYNFTDKELDLLKGLYGKASSEEQNLIAKIGRLVTKVEFWKKGK
jgi:hypothetical protein